VIFDCSDADDRAKGLREAAYAVRRGDLVVLPTDTVYGIGADAFTPSAVAALLAAKGRGRDMPVPVLVGSVPVLDALVSGLPSTGRALMEAFWPGALTIVCHHTQALAWDLGETRGTVAVRMPDHPVALDLLKETGPMAVSSANRSGLPPATTCANAHAQLGDAVSIYLDAGPSGDPVPSSIVDLSGDVPVLLRAGAISADRLREVAPDLVEE
jgi:tRNA threonylcarbamoyl adenosine modification protein (Sua5/YciO/YrdC/YwlC family)